MRRLLPSFLMIVVVAGFSLSARAETEEYMIDRPHTQIIFFVDHLGFSKSSGKFTDYEGHFTFDREQPENSSVEVTIRTNSLDMADEKWDAHMKGADFFDVETFPTMTFKSTKIEVTGENMATITGDLTLLGVTRPVVLDAVHNRSAKHSFSGKYVAGFSGTTHLKRSDFGMNYGLPLVGDDVEIRLEVEGIRTKPADTENVNE